VNIVNKILVYNLNPFLTCAQLSFAVTCRLSLDLNLWTWRFTVVKNFEWYYFNKNRIWIIGIVPSFNVPAFVSRTLVSYTASPSLHFEPVLIIWYIFQRFSFNRLQVLNAKLSWLCISTLFASLISICLHLQFRVGHIRHLRCNSASCSSPCIPIRTWQPTAVRSFTICRHAFVRPPWT